LGAICCLRYIVVFFFSSRRRHTRSKRDWSSDVCSSDLISQIVLKNDEVKDIQKLIVLKEGDALHVEVIAEIAPNLTVAYTNELRDDIEALILKQSHVTDVNMEFEVDDGKRSWPVTQNQMDRK